MKYVYVNKYSVKHTFIQFKGKNMSKKLKKETKIRKIKMNQKLNTVKTIDNSGS